MIKQILKPTAPLFPLAIARMLMGILWLYSLRWKLPPTFMPAEGPGLMHWLELEVAHPAFGFYASFIQTVVIPNFTLFAWLIFLAELTTGLLLLSGTLTRLGAALGLLMSINLGIGLLEVPGEWPWSYMMMIMWHGTLLVAHAGRLWGGDYWLAKRPIPSWLRWMT